MNRETLIIDCGSLKSPEIARIATDLGQANTLIKLSDFSWNESNNYQTIIISGAPILVTEIDYEPYLERFSFLNKLDIPVFGICFGHQILGLLSDAKPLKCVPQRDWQDIHFKANDYTASGTVSFSQDHCECITCPSDYTIVGSSDTCDNEMMSHHSKPWLGVQFHPEVSGSQGESMIQRFLSNACS